MKFLPFLNGTYSTAPGLAVLGKAVEPENRFVFQFDEKYPAYINNKKNCRREGIEKYYLEASVQDSTMIEANKYIVAQLVKEHPEIFRLTQSETTHTLENQLTSESLSWKSDWRAVDNSNYKSLFDALCSQVQEDVAVYQLTDVERNDYLTAIHLCSPNHWSPADKIGKPFQSIHEPVPAMEAVTKNYPKMLSSIVNTIGPYIRFAWGIATDNRLNHHPSPPRNIDDDSWSGRKLITDDSKFFIRTERQVLIGLKQVNAFLFTIRTYFYEIATLSNEERTALLSAVNSMSKETQHYKGLTNTIQQLKSLLST